MAYTLAEARTRIADDLLDDPNNTRWPVAAIDRALKSNLSRCLESYAAHGGDRFLQDSGSVAASSGTYDASSLNVLSIVNVSLLESNFELPLPAVHARDRYLNTSDDRNIRILYVERYALTTTTSEPLVGVGATAANTWDAFDDWICHESAMELELREREQATERLTTAVARSRASVLDHVATPRVRRFPRSRPRAGYAWFWLPPGTVYLTRR